MRWCVWLTLASTLLLPSSTYALDNSILSHVCPTDRARYRIDYSGPLGAVLDECVRFLARSWHDSLERRYIDGNSADDDGRYSYWLGQVACYESDYKTGRWSDARFYWWHFATDWGPIETHIVGRNSDVLNLGPIRVTRKFKFKLKGYEARLSSQWNFKFKPRVDFTSKWPLVKRVAARVQFVYRLRGLKLVQIEMGVGVRVDKKDLFGWVAFSLTNW